MLIQLRKAWPYAVVLGIAYLVVPLIGSAILSGTGADDMVVTGFYLTALVGYYPALTFAVSSLAGFRHGLIWLLVPLVAVAFVPTVNIIYNASAYVYAGVYAVFAALGLLAGWGLRRALAARRSAKQA